jgi:hypothetical protein
MQIPIASSATVKVSTVSFFRVDEFRSGAWADLSCPLSRSWELFCTMTSHGGLYRRFRLPVANFKILQVSTKLNRLRSGQLEF